MRWPWTRQPNAEAKAAIADAEKQHKDAKAKQVKADATARVAKDLSRRSDKFAREIERAWHLRRGAT